MKKILVVAFLLLSLAGSPMAALVADLDQYVQGAQYLEDYQARYERNQMIVRGIFFLLLAAGGIIVALKIKKKGQKKP